MYSYTVWSDYRRGFRLDIGFIDHFYTLLWITSNYSATANLHNSQITTAPAKPFPACRGNAFYHRKFFSFRAHVLCEWRFLSTWTIRVESSQVLCYDRQSVSQSVLELSIHLGLTTRYLSLLESCEFVVRRSLWREVGSVVYNCCWPSPAQSFSGPTLVGLATIFYRFNCPYNPFAWRAENTVPNSTSIVACVSVAEGTCLPSRCLVEAVYSCLLKSVA
jgi:hypothetical protein